MDIANVSTIIKDVEMKNEVGVAMLDKSLDMTEAMGDSMINMMKRLVMEQSINPNLGTSIDLYV